MPRLTLRTRRSSRQSQSAENVSVSRVITNNDDQPNDSAPATDETQKSGRLLSIASQSSQRRRLNLATSLAKLKKPRKFESDDDSLPPVSRNNSITTPSSGLQYIQLPIEIQLHILAFLDSHDILVFRHLSKACCQLVSNYATTIAHDILSSMAPAVNDGHKYNSPIPGEPPNHAPEPFGSLLLCLYHAPTENSLLSFMRNQSRMTALHDQSRVSSLLETVLSFIRTRIYMHKLTSHLPETQFSAYHSGLVERLHIPISLICHMISTTATHVLYHHLCSHQLTVDPVCVRCEASLAELIEDTVAKYPAEQLIPMYHVFMLIQLHLRLALQPPSSIGPIERRFRGWGYGPPPARDLSIFVIFGGAEMLRKVDEMRGSYSKRLETVRTFVEDRVRNTARANSSEQPLEVVRLVKSRRENHWEKERERCKEGQDVLLDLEEVRFDHLTWAELECVPDVEGFLVGVNGLLDRRIQELGLVGDWWTEGENSSPYPWLRRLLGACLDTETAGCTL